MAIVVSELDEKLRAQAAFSGTRRDTVVPLT
jgi:hypothetical protein